MSANLKTVQAETVKPVSFGDLEPIIGDLHRWVELLVFKCCDDLNGVSFQIADQVWNEAEKLKTTFYAAWDAEKKTTT